MTRKCSIIGCRGNYRQRNGEEGTDNRVTIFRFPTKDIGKLSEWLRRIPQKIDASSITEHMGICEKHFDPRYIVREYSARRPDGTVFTVPRTSPILSDDAIPTVFENTPSYCSVQLPAKRKHPDDRRAEIDCRDNVVLQQWMDSDRIKDYTDLCNNVHSKTVELCGQWSVIVNNSFVSFVNIDVTASPVVLCSFKVFVDLSVVAFNNRDQIPADDLRFLLGSECILAHWSQVSNLCSFLKNVSQAPNEEFSVEKTVDDILIKLKFAW